MDINSEFYTILQSIGLVCIDVGARRGVGTDLLSLAPKVDFYAFEPDPEECEKLNKSFPSPWGSLTFIPTALGESNGSFDLNLYRHRGCSSKLMARKEVGELFSRGEYYIHDGVITVPVKRLDDVVESFPICQPAYMKIDVQGMEIDVFKGGHKTLSESLVAIRTEVNFFPLYDDLPLFAEVEQTLRPYGFVPMRFLEMHEWRRSTHRKFPNLASGSMPFSQGQMIHGDVLFMLHPEGMPSENEDQIKRLVRLALIAVCYDHLDHAKAVFSKSRVIEFCRDLDQKIDPVKTLHDLSQLKARQFCGFRELVSKIYEKIVK